MIAGTLAQATADLLPDLFVAIAADWTAHTLLINDHGRFWSGESVAEAIARMSDQHIECFGAPDDPESGWPFQFHPEWFALPRLCGHWTF